MTHLTDDGHEHDDEQQFSICPHCGEDLPHHNCQDDEREREEY